MILRNKKALSPVIAGIILIAVTVAVAIAATTWLGSMSFSFMKTEQVSITDQAWGSDISYVDILVRNIGTDLFTINNVQVNKEVITTISYETGSETLGAGESAVIRVNYSFISGKKYELSLITNSGNTFSHITSASAGSIISWLSGWRNRVKVTIDSNDIDSELTDFPLLVYLSSSSGENNDDVTEVFDEVGSDYNAAAFTGSDGTSRLYFEVEYWNAASEEAWMWVKVPSISNTTDTDIYIYYDSINDGSAYNSPTNVWDSNFKMVQHLEETSGTHYDSTSNNNDGTQGGGVTQDATGKIDGADEFDGTNDYVDCGNIGTLNSPFTVEAWMYFSNLNQPNGDYDYVLIIGTPLNSISISRNAADAATGANKYYSWTENGQLMGPVLSGQQYLHVVAMWDSSSPYHRLYINGASQTVDQPTGAINTNGEVDLGLYKPGPTHYINGIIDEVRISNVVRSASWIKATYESERDNLLSFGSEETT